MKPRRSRKFCAAQGSVISVCDSLLTMESTSSLSTTEGERIAKLMEEYSEENLTRRFDDGGGDKNREADEFGRSSALYDAMMRVFERVKKCASTAYCSLPDRRGGSTAPSSGSCKQVNESDELARSMATFLHRTLIADEDDGGDELRRFAASLINEWRKQGSSRIRTSTRLDQPVSEHTNQKEEDESSRILSFKSSTTSSGDDQARGESYQHDAMMEPDRNGCRNRHQANRTEVKRRRSERKEEAEHRRRWSDFEQASSYYCSDDLFHAGKKRRCERDVRLIRKGKGRASSVKTKRPARPHAEDFEHKIYCLW